MEVAEQEIVGDILKSMKMGMDETKGALMPPADEEAMAMVDEAGKAKLEEMKALSGADFDKAWKPARWFGCLETRLKGWGPDVLPPSAYDHHHARLELRLKCGATFSEFVTMPALGRTRGRRPPALLPGPDHGDPGHMAEGSSQRRAQRPLCTRHASKSPMNSSLVLG